MPSDDRIAHGFRHQHGILRFGNGGVHQHPIGAQFHGDGGIGSCANSGIHDHRNFRDALAENPQIGGILNAQTGTDGRGQRHHRRCASVNQLACGDQVVVGVRQDHEAFLHQNARGLDELLRVRKKCLLVANHFKLDPIRKPHFARQPRRADGFFRGVARRGIRQNEHLLPVDIVEQRFLRFVGQIHAAHRHRDHLRSRSGVRPRHFLKTAVLPCSHNQPRLKRAPGNHQIIRHSYLNSRSQEGF